MSLPRYPRYKDSGVEWLGEVPEHWDVVPLKRIVKLRSGDSISADDISEVGDYPVYGGNGLRGYTSSYTHEGDLVLIGRQGALCGNVNYARGKFWASEHAVVASPSWLLSTTWLGEMLRAMDLNRYSVTAAQPGLSVDVVANLRTALPPVDEQLAIGAFLDHEIHKIEGLIVDQQRLVELLKEKRQTVISHAVTKGLNPIAPMKASGIEWLGEVPAHWAVKRLKHVSPEITVGIVVEPSKYYVPDGVPALRSLNVQPGTISLDNLVFISADANELHSKSKLRAGDLVAVRSGQPGTAAIVPPGLDGCNCIDLIIIRRPHSVSEQFLCWYLASDAAVSQFSSGSGGAIQQHFNVGAAANMFVPAPPVREQQAIVAFINAAIEKTDALATEAQKAEFLLTERRAALISSAVTGQIDVSEAVA